MHIINYDYDYKYYKKNTCMFAWVIMKYDFFYTYIKQEKCIYIKNSIQSVEFFLGVHSYIIKRNVLF